MVQRNMELDKRVIQLTVTLILVLILHVLTSCTTSNKATPSFEKFDFFEKVESFDVDNDGRFVLLVGNCANLYDSKGNFIKCFVFEKAGSAYAFFTDEGSLAVYHYRTNKLYYFNEETEQFYEAQDSQLDLNNLENTTTVEGINKTVYQGENEFYIKIPTFSDFLFGNSSTIVTKSYEKNETIIFDDGGAIYFDYYLSVILAVTGFTMFFALVLVLVININKKRRMTNSRSLSS